MDAITEAYYKVKYPLTEAEQKELDEGVGGILSGCLLYTSPSPRDPE